MFLGSNMHVMTQALEEGDGSCLSHRLRIMNTYKKMVTGSKRVAAMVNNLTATLITIAKGVKMAQVIVANVIPQVGVSPGMLDKLNKMQGSRELWCQLSRERKHSSSSWRWSSKNWTVTHALLADYHAIFSLEPRKLGCTDLANTRSKSLMMSPSRRGSGEFLHLWR